MTTINALTHQAILNGAIQRVRKANINTWAIFGVENVDFNVRCQPDNELILFVFAEGYGENFRPLLTPNCIWYLYINLASFGDRPTRRLYLVYFVGDQLDRQAVSSYANVFAYIENIIMKRDVIFVATKPSEVIDRISNTVCLRGTDSPEQRRNSTATMVGSLPILSRNRTNTEPQQTSINAPVEHRNLKIVIIGNISTGKTSIAKFLCQGLKLNDAQGQPALTIGIDIFSTRISVDNSIVPLDIFDTAGQERFNALPRSYFRNANGVVLVYSNDNLKSFEALDNWLSYAKQNTLDNIPAFILIGNKNDIASRARKISHERVSAFCQQKGIAHIETSAKTGDNITEAFIQLIRMYFSINRNNTRSPTRRPTVDAVSNELPNVVLQPPHAEVPKGAWTCC